MWDVRTKDLKGGRKVEVRWDEEEWRIIERDFTREGLGVEQEREEDGRKF